MIINTDMEHVLLVVPVWEREDDGDGLLHAPVEVGREPLYCSLLDRAGTVGNVKTVLVSCIKSPFGFKYVTTA